MAGTFPDFDADEFRTNIRFVYNMAAPPILSEQPVFYFPTQLVYSTPVDGEDTPFDPNATVVRTQPDPVRNVPCGIEYFDAQGQEIVFGTVTPTKVVITLLDEDYLLVKGCEYVVIAGDKYIFKRTEPPTGLFDVGLYSLHFLADQET